jgi:hypothetical protein
MSEIGRPVREWRVKEQPLIPKLPEPEPQRERKEVPVPEREKEKVGASAHRHLTETDDG